MTIAEMLQSRLSEWEPAGVGRHSWAQSLADTGWSLHLTVDRADTLGCIVWELALVRASAGPHDNGELKARAVQAAQRVTGLMEPLRFLELDETRGEALLRSSAPTHRSDALSYYEVIMTQSNQIHVRRYKAAPAARREQVGFALTHEAIAKLVDDLVRV